MAVRVSQELMVAKDFWSDEDMSAVNAAIAA
jgi:hypothetical protein